MTRRPSRSPFSLFRPPYHVLVPVSRDMGAVLEPAAERGTALIWSLHPSRSPGDVEFAISRPAGVSLIVILPPADRLDNGAELLTTLGRCRPMSILPYHPEPDPEDLTMVLRRPPEALPVELTDYLSWRGIRVDGDTRHLIRRTIELSAEIRTISGLSRAVYLSRRALGRRFMSRGLPVPSHWLHFGRVLRAALRLQSTDESLYAIASDLGYPDGFALSNQMKRLIGVRPSTVRECLGWEWIVEAWLQIEAADDNLKLPLRETGWTRTPDVPNEPPSVAAGPKWRVEAAEPAGRGA